MDIRFSLNENNEKDKLIIDMLSEEYSPTQSVKAILYKVALNGGLWSKVYQNGNYCIEESKSENKSTPILFDNRSISAKDVQEWQNFFDEE